MKKAMAFLMGLWIAIGLLTACTAQKTQSSNTTTTQSNATQPGNSATTQSNTTQTNPTQPPAVNMANLIGEDRAKDIALAQAGLSLDAVRFEHVELDFENGVWQYEVEFNSGSTEYDVDINAESGAVLKWDVDIE